MIDELKVNQRLISLMKGDLTDLKVDAIVYYARPDLILSSGYGGAIAEKGGPIIQEELSHFVPISIGEAVVTSAGKMNARYIIHAVGPRFQEEELEEKLGKTIWNVLKIAEEKGIKSLAFPAMGVGFYGIPLNLCARVSLMTVRDYLHYRPAIEEVIFCLRDFWEYQAFQQQMEKMKKQEDLYKEDKDE